MEKFTYVEVSFMEEVFDTIEEVVESEIEGAIEEAFQEVLTNEVIEEDSEISDNENKEKVEAEVQVENNEVVEEKETPVIAEEIIEQPFDELEGLLSLSSSSAADDHVTSLSTEDAYEIMKQADTNKNGTIDIKMAIR